MFKWFKWVFIVGSQQPNVTLILYPGLGLGMSEDTTIDRVESPRRIRGKSNLT